MAGKKKGRDAYEHSTEVAGSGDRFADDPSVEHQDAGPRNVRNEVDPEHLADAGTHGPETRRETRITEAEGLKRQRDRES